jgi:hypothetical protein
MPYTLDLTGLYNGPNGSWNLASIVPRSDWTLPTMPATPPDTTTIDWDMTLDQVDNGQTWLYSNAVGLPLGYGAPAAPPFPPPTPDPGWVWRPFPNSPGNGSWILPSEPLPPLRIPVYQGPNGPTYFRPDQWEGIYTGGSGVSPPTAPYKPGLITTLLRPTVAMLLLGMDGHDPSGCVAELSAIKGNAEALGAILQNFNNIANSALNWNNTQAANFPPGSDCWNKVQALITTLNKGFNTCYDNIRKATVTYNGMVNPMPGVVNPPNCNTVKQMNGDIRYAVDSVTTSLNTAIAQFNYLVQNCSMTLKPAKPSAGTE